MTGNTGKVAGTLYPLRDGISQRTVSMILRDLGYTTVRYVPRSRENGPAIFIPGNILNEERERHLREAGIIY